MPSFLISNKEFNWHVLPTLICLCVEAVLPPLCDGEAIAVQVGFAELSHYTYKYVQTHMLLSSSCMAWYRRN